MHYLEPPFQPLSIRLAFRGTDLHPPTNFGWLGFAAFCSLAMGGRRAVCQSNQDLEEHVVAQNILGDSGGPASLLGIQLQSGHLDFIKTEGTGA